MLIYSPPHTLYILAQETLSPTSVGYSNSVEALNELLRSCVLSEISVSLSRLSNGLEYSFVEITCSDGAQYGLQAYGEEALELNRAAHKNMSKAVRNTLKSASN